MKWYETDRFILVCLLLTLCEIAVGWAIWNAVSLPPEGIVIEIVSKETAEAIARAIEQHVMRPILEKAAERVRREQGEESCRVTGYLFAAMTVPEFCLAIWATRQSAEGRQV